MRSAAGASAAALQPQRQKRRSDRRKKQDRRDKARKVQSVAGSSEHQEYQAAVWLDALEDVDPSAGLAQDNDEEYDVMDELDDHANKKGSKKRSRKAASAVKAGVLPKRFSPRPLASILVEEANREEGTARAFIDAEARIQNPNQQLPKRKFCPVTGLRGIYTEPKSEIPYANLKALEQIRERAPPWMTLSGTASYWEAAKSLRDEES